MKTDGKYLEYKGYTGSIEFSLDDNLLFGKVVGIPSLISYEGDTLEALKEDFKGAVDDYLAFCKAENIRPEKANLGSFNVRLGTELYFKATKAAQELGISLNGYVKKAIEASVLN